MLRNFLKIFTLLLVLLVQTACTFSVDVVSTPTSPEATRPAPTPTQPAATAIPTMVADADGCPIASTGDAVAYRNDENRYCLLYPQNFTVMPPRFIVFNPTNAPGGDKLGDAVVDIQVEPANGRTVDQVVVDATAALDSGSTIQMAEIVVDGTRAFYIDGIPAQDPMRNVYVVIHDRLYTITFFPWGNNPELDTAYDWVMKTIHFLP